MFLAELFAEAAQPQLVVFYPGRFQPFHLGHRDVFASLQAQFGRDAVYIATSNKVELPKSPFNFSEKVTFMNAAGVNSDRIIQVASPYKLPDEFNPANTIFIVAIGDLDARRLNPGGTKKDGTPGYFQNFESIAKCTTADKHGYVIIAEERDDVKITLLGKEVDVSHGTPSRAAWNKVRNDPKGREEYLVQMFGRNDPELGRILDKIPAEQVTETIRQVKGGYRLVSHTGKNLGTYPSRTGAEKRERQVQYFKHASEGSLNESPAIDLIRSLIREFNKQMSGSEYYPMDYKNPGMRMWTRGDGSKYKDPGYIFIERDLKPEDQPKWHKAKAVEKFWKFLESKGARKIGDVSGEFGSDPHSPAVVLNKLIFVFNGRSIAWGSTSRLKNSSVWRQKQPGVAEGVKEANTSHQHHVVSKLDGNVLASYKTKQEAHKNAHGNPVVSGSLETIGDKQYVREQGVAEGLGKDLKRLATGKDVKSRAGQEIAKAQQASMTGDNKTSHKHFKRYDKLDKLANKEQGVAEGSLNEFAPDGFNGGDDEEEFNIVLAKLAYEEGIVKGVSLADGATTKQAMAIKHWDSFNGGMYKQYFAKGFKKGRLDKINHANKQYGLNLKLMKDGSVRHGEQGVAEGLADTQQKIVDTINKLEDRLKHAKTPEQWDRINARIERLQAGLNRSKQGVAEDAAGVGVVKNSKDPRYVMATMGDQNDVTAATLPKEMQAYGLIGRKTPKFSKK